jgi:hypothetical protein
MTAMRCVMKNLNREIDGMSEMREDFFLLTQKEQFEVLDALVRANHQFQEQEKKLADELTTLRKENEDLKAEVENWKLRAMELDEQYHYDVFHLTAERDEMKRVLHVAKAVVISRERNRFKEALEDLSSKIFKVKQAVEDSDKDYEQRLHAILLDWYFIATEALKGDKP